MVILLKTILWYFCLKTILWAFKAVYDNLFKKKRTFFLNKTIIQIKYYGNIKKKIKKRRKLIYVWWGFYI